MEGVVRLSMDLKEIATPDDVQSVRTSASPTADESPCGDTRVQLDDALAQLEVARHQRTEVSSELFKCRCVLDELKEQKAQLQTELTRRLATHREDVTRISTMQKELDSLRGSYTAKETEIIDLSTRVQDLVAKLQSTEQHRELKEENQLLWRKLEEIEKQKVAFENEEDAASRAELWRNRFSALEGALTDAFTARVPAGSAEPLAEINPAAMLQEILGAEDLLRRTLTTQLAAVKTDLRKAKDELDSYRGKIALNEVATVKANISSQDHLLKLEAEKDQMEKRLRSDLDTAKADATRTRADLQRAQAVVLDLKRSLLDANAAVVAATASAPAPNDELQDELRSTKTRCEELGAEYERVQDELTRVQTQLSRVETARDRAEAARDRAEDRMEMALTEARRDTEDVKRKLAATERACTELERQLATSGGGEISTLKRQLENEREEFKEGQQEWWRIETQLKKERDAAQAKLRHLEVSQKPAVDKNLRQEIETHKARVTALEEELENAIQRHKEECNGLRDRLEEAQSGGSDDQQRPSIDQVREELAAQTREVREEFQKKIDELSAAREQLAAELTETQQSREQLATELTETQQAREQLATELTETQQAREQLAAELTETQQARNEIEAQLTSTRDTLEKRIAEVEQQLNEAVDGPTVATLVSAACGAVDDERSLSAEQQVVRLKMALKRANEARREAADIADVQTVRVNDLTTELVALRAQMGKIEDGWKAEYEVYVANLSRVTNVLDRALADKKTVEEELANTRAKVITLGNAVTKLTNQISARKGLAEEDSSRIPKSVPAVTLKSPQKPKAGSKRPDDVSKPTPAIESILRTFEVSSKRPEPSRDFSVVKIVGVLCLLCFVSFWWGQIAQ